MVNKIETMTSRERVINAINHKPIDRMPIDLGMHNSSGISAFAYWNLREYLGLSTDNINIFDMVQFLAKVDDDILKRFHCDCVALHPGWTTETKWSPRGKYKFHIPQTAKPLLDEEGNWVINSSSGKLVMPNNGFFFDGAWPDFTGTDFDENVLLTAKEAEIIYKDTDYFTTYIGFYGYFNSSDIEWQCRMLTDPEDIIEENERIHKKQIEKTAKVIKEMGNYIQAIAINSDLGSQIGTLCRPSVYEELCAPYLKKLCDFIHQNSNIKTFLHCCGSIKPLIPILIDCGIDIINPVQISANNMDAKELKSEFGDKITFWGGGCDTQNILNKGTPEQVSNNVKDLISIFKPGGGFIFNQVHNIMGDIKPENIITMLDTAYQESFF